MSQVSLTAAPDHERQGGLSYDESTPVYNEQFTVHSEFTSISLQSVRYANSVIEN